MRPPGLFPKPKFVRLRLILQTGRHENLDLRTLRTIRKHLPRTGQHLLEGRIVRDQRGSPARGQPKTQDVGSQSGFVVRIASVPSQE